MDSGAFIYLLDLYATIPSRQRSPSLKYTNGRSRKTSGGGGLAVLQAGMQPVHEPETPALMLVPCLLAAPVTAVL